MMIEVLTIQIKIRTHLQNWVQFFAFYCSYKNILHRLTFIINSMYYLFKMWTNVDIIFVFFMNDFFSQGILSLSNISHSFLAPLPILKIFHLSPCAIFRKSYPTPPTKCGGNYGKRHSLIKYLLCNKPFTSELISYYQYCNIWIEV